MMSFDKARKKFVLRQFHGEGFVNQYVMTSSSDDGKTIVFTSMVSPNGISVLREYRQFREYAVRRVRATSETLRRGIKGAISQPAVRLVCFSGTRQRSGFRRKGAVNFWRVK
jgi:hypothetical protein